MLNEPDTNPRGLILKATIDDIPVDVQLDPGATRPVISEKTVHTLGLNTYEDNMPINISSVFGEQNPYKLNRNLLEGHQKSIKGN